MINLGYKDCKYTWINKRHRNRFFLILKRLDRCVANKSWIKHFPNSCIMHISRTKSDHCSFLLSLTEPTSPVPRPFKLEPIWCSHPTFRALIDQYFPPYISLFKLSKISNQQPFLEMDKPSKTFSKIKIKRTIAILDGI